MLRFEFILPFIYGGITSITVIKMGLFNLGMNFVTWGIYFTNLFIAYILYIRQAQKKYLRLNF